MCTCVTVHRSVLTASHRTPQLAPEALTHSWEKFTDFKSFTKIIIVGYCYSLVIVNHCCLLTPSVLLMTSYTLSNTIVISSCYLYCISLCILFLLQFTHSTQYYMPMFCLQFSVFVDSFPILSLTSVHCL